MQNNVLYILLLRILPFPVSVKIPYLESNIVLLYIQIFFELKVNAFVALINILFWIMDLLHKGYNWIKFSIFVNVQFSTRRSLQPVVGSLPSVTIPRLKSVIVSSFNVTLFVEMMIPSPLPEPIIMVPLFPEPSNPIELFIRMNSI